MTKRFSLNLSLLPSSTANVPASVSPSSYQQPTRTQDAPGGAQTAPVNVGVGQSSGTELGLMYVQREDLHKQLRSLE